MTRICFVFEALGTLLLGAGLILATGAGAQAAVRGAYSPPRQALTVAIGDHIFAKSEVYLSCHADTVALKQEGFRNFEFLGWVVSRIHYAALCPLDWAGESLPPQISGISYITPNRPSAEKYDDDFGYESYPISYSSTPSRTRRSSFDDTERLQRGFKPSAFDCSSRRG
jgi:hypothetical protein